jgi:hypothetical protein
MVFLLYYYKVTSSSVNCRPHSDSFAQAEKKVRMNTWCTCIELEQKQYVIKRTENRFYLQSLKRFKEWLIFFFKKQLTYQELGNIFCRKHTMFYDFMSYDVMNESPIGLWNVQNIKSPSVLAPLTSGTPNFNQRRALIQGTYVPNSIKIGPGNREL